MSKHIIQVLIFTLITALAWLGFELFHQAKQTTLPEIVQEQIVPLDPKLPIEVFEELKQREVVGEELGY